VVLDIETFEDSVLAQFDGCAFPLENQYGVQSFVLSVLLSLANVSFKVEVPQPLAPVVALPIHGATTLTEVQPSEVPLPVPVVVVVPNCKALPLGLLPPVTVLVVPAVVPLTAYLFHYLLFGLIANILSHTSASFSC
jgi:hypothetical protein